MKIKVWKQLASGKKLPMMDLDVKKGEEVAARAKVESYKKEHEDAAPNPADFIMVSEEVA